MHREVTKNDKPRRLEPVDEKTERLRRLPKQLRRVKLLRQKALDDA